MRESNDQQSDEMKLWAFGGMSVPAVVEFLGFGRTKTYQEMDAGRLVYRMHGTRRIVSRLSTIRLLGSGSPSRGEHLNSN